MTPTRQGSFHLFRLAGIDVFVHWSWFLVAVIEVNNRRTQYTSMMWNALEYLSLFGIVLLHEFGHALACRQVGGQADQIVLWPLGGVAYVAPPLRPGATFWSIAAGPLVNVALAPILTALAILAHSAGWGETMPNTMEYLQAVCVINYALLIFNILPIYPLDGGQILRSILWFFTDRGRSLMIAATIGLIGVVALFGLAVFARSFWIGLMTVFILLNCWQGLMQARLLGKLARLPRRTGFLCPSCRQPPIIGQLWRCRQCGHAFDTFESNGACPQCGAQPATTQCPECGQQYPFANWIVGPPMS